MKYIILIGDGMADYPLEVLNLKTPLQIAKTPNLDYLAKNGIVGTTRNIPEGMPPGSDVAIMSVLGYNPQMYYTGRAPLEAASMGIELKENQVAFRCNLVTARENILADYSAGHITTSDAHQLIETLNKKIGNSHIRFYPGVSYRHLMVIEGDFQKVMTIPPHDITGQELDKYLPKGNNFAIIREIMFASHEFLMKHKVNIKRKESGLSQANMIWLWGQGKAPVLPPLTERFNISGAVISAVDLVKGLGKYAGLKIIDVPGATGYYDTNYLGKAESALEALKEMDIVLIHVEAPDEASHNGNIKAKIKAIEDFDKKVVLTIINGISKYDNVRILALTDHETPISLKTHATGSVPFALWASQAEVDNSIDTTFDEVSARNGSIQFEQGYKLIDLLFSS